MRKLNEQAAHTYLSQPLWLNEQIDRDIMRSQTLRTLMMSAPCNAADNQAADIARELAELEARIIADIDALVDLKVEITHRIKRVVDIRAQIILELRYLCGRTWEQVAGDLGLSIAYVLRLYKVALIQFHGAETEP